MATEIERAIIFVQEARAKLEDVAHYMDPKDINRQDMLDVVEDLGAALYTLESLGNARWKKKD